MSKIQTRSTLTGLLALYFALGYLVGRISVPEVVEPETPVASTPQTMMASNAVGATHLPSLPPSPTPQSAVPTPQPAAPTPATAAPTPAPTAPAPAPAPTAPAPAPTAPTPPAPSPTPPQAAAAASPPGTIPPDENQIWRVSISENDASFGPSQAPATVVLFSAFGCDTCAGFQNARLRLKEQFGDKVRIVFKHKVVPLQHPDSLEASMAALAAKEQGKFWEYHDKLFETVAMDPTSLEQHARDLGLDLAKFNADRQSARFRQQALRDSLVANEVGAHSMPNVLVNGVRMRGGKTHENMVSLIERVLPTAEEAISAGADAATYYAQRVADGKHFQQLQEGSAQFNNAGSAAIGPENAKIQVVSFEDFQCPYCARIGPSLKSFQARYPNDVRVVFKHMPLASIHDDAMLASEAAREAQAQGKFWELHDILMANQSALARPNLEQYAERVGLDMTRFRQALDTGLHRNAVAAEVNEGVRAGARGTPTVFINGKRYQGPRGYPPEGLEAVSHVYLGLN